MNIALNILLVVVGFFAGAITTFFVMKNIAAKNEQNLQKAYSDIYEKMQLQFENLSNRIFKETTQDFSISS